MGHGAWGQTTDDRGQATENNFELWMANLGLRIADGYFGEAWSMGHRVKSGMVEYWNNGMLG